MKTALSDIHTPWVEQTLASLLPDERLAQLLHTTVTPDLTPESWMEQTDGLTPGGVFIFTGARETFRRTSAIIQRNAKVPVVVSSDAENGPARLIKDATTWPEMMGMGAADDLDLSFEMGRSCAVECRDAGVHWTLGPVVDLNVHPHNPITSTRSLGDEPAHVGRHAAAMIRAMQEGGLATTPKHFPGDGYDDRDQHLCRTINPQSMEQWRRTSGAAFRSAIEAGAWTVMLGHIALPAWDPGIGTVDEAPPATLSRPLIEGLLRQELGFEGLILSDAMGMGGITSWGPREITLPAAIMAGCDQLLFMDMKRDLGILRDAIADGRLTWERVDTAVRRILRLKEVLGLCTESDALPRPAPSADLERFREGARRATERSLTLVKDKKGIIPFDPHGKKVTVIHLLGDQGYPLDHFNDALRDAGALLTHYTESNMPEWPPDGWLRGQDLVILAFAFNPNWGISRIRPSGPFLRPIAGSVLAQHDVPVIGISFGSPYHLHDFPQLTAMINCHSQHSEAQRLAVSALSGRIPFVGTSPVDLGKVTGCWHQLS